MLSLFLQALLVNDRKLFRGPVTREITELGEHLLLVVHALAEMKEFNIGICARVVPLSVNLRVVVLEQLVVNVVFRVALIVHRGDV